MSELLAPAGDFERLKTAFYFGADACYIGGNRFSLRAFANNFNEKELEKAIAYAHALDKKVYVALNIFPKNDDFGAIKQYLAFLEQAMVDAVIVTDVGVMAMIKTYFPKLEIHLSTQANTTNGYTAKFWSDFGVKRIVLARELSLTDIAKVRDMLPDNTQIECFVHGAMCISYSGRCLLSNYLSERDSNRGECVQACRWQYQLREINRDGDYLTLVEDEKGSYVLNSKDLCMIEYIDELIKAGVYSFKIEGRMKTQYYVGNVVNAYRRAIDKYDNNCYNDQEKSLLLEEMYKVSHRGYTSGFYFGARDTVAINSSMSNSSYDFVARVLGYDNQKQCAVIEQRNRFSEGDYLEILSNNSTFNKQFKVTAIYNQNGEQIKQAKLVQEVVYVPCEYKLQENDLLRIKRN